MPPAPTMPVSTLLPVGPPVPEVVVLVTDEAETEVTTVSVALPPPNPPPIPESVPPTLLAALVLTGPSVELSLFVAVVLASSEHATLPSMVKARTDATRTRRRRHGSLRTAQFGACTWLILGSGRSSTNPWGPIPVPFSSDLETRTRSRLV